MKHIAFIAIIVIGCIDIAALKWHLDETKATLAYVRAENTHKLKPYFIGKVLKKDTVPGYYSYQVLGDEDMPENAVTLTTKNLYRVGDYITTQKTDSIK